MSLSFRLSFYSGHSSFGMYCMLFLAVSGFVYFVIYVCMYAVLVVVVLGGGGCSCKEGKSFLKAVFMNYLSDRLFNGGRMEWRDRIMRPVGLWDIPVMFRHDNGSNTIIIIIIIMMISWGVEMVWNVGGSVIAKTHHVKILKKKRLFLLTRRGRRV